MMEAPGTLKVAIILIAVGIVGLFVVGLLTGTPSMQNDPYLLRSSGFQSNGERIYFTATSDSGNPILASMGMMTMHGGMMSCATCHGANGKGGSGRMMMWIYEAPDIRYSTLATEGHGEHADEKPYDDELLKRAITQGIDADGDRLDPPMPIWQMSDEDLNDLIAFLKTLD